MEDTELRLGLPGSDGARNNKRPLNDTREDSLPKDQPQAQETATASKAQVAGWPPIRSYRKNSLQQKKGDEEAEASGIYVKVSMDGVPFLRKIDLKVYKGYSDLLNALETMFKLTIGEYSEREGYKGSEYAPTYEDKDGDLMLVGDVPWDMFMSSCKRLRIMKQEAWAVEYKQTTSKPYQISCALKSKAKKREDPFPMRRNQTP